MVIPSNINYIKVVTAAYWIDRTNYLIIYVIDMNIQVLRELSKIIINIFNIFNII